MAIKIPPGLGTAGALLWGREAEARPAMDDRERAEVLEQCRALDREIPDGLDDPGETLWAEIMVEYEPDQRERTILESASRQLDAIARLEAMIAEAGMMVEGSARQPRLHPAVAEVRLGRLALGRLLGQLDLPSTEAERPTSEASKRARHAANARWARVVDLQERRRETP